MPDGEKGFEKATSLVAKNLGLDSQRYPKVSAFPGVDTWAERISIPSRSESNRPTVPDEAAALMLSATSRNW